MKQLSTVLNNILPTAETTECVPVEQKYFLTKEDGKMITQEVEQFKALTPAEAMDKALILLQKLGNLQKTPRRTYDWIIGGRNGGDSPPIIEYGELNEKAKSVAKELALQMSKPITKQEFAVLYAKLKVLCKWHSVPADEVVIMSAYYDELKKYPAISVREALKPKYEWFPSYLELENEIKSNSEHLLLFQKRFLGGNK